MSEFDDLGEAEAFAAGQLVQREKYLARLTRDVVKAREEGYEALRSSVSKQLDTSTSALEQLAALFRRATVEQARTLDSLMRDRPMPPGEERDALLAAPFDGPESNGSDSKALPRPTPRALPGGKAHLPEEPPKRKRGRPNKEEVLRRQKAKEKSEGVGTPNPSPGSGESPHRPEHDES